MSYQKGSYPSNGIATITDGNSIECPPANRLMALERENLRLRQLVAELVQEKNMFSHIATRNW